MVRSGQTHPSTYTEPTQHILVGVGDMDSLVSDLRIVKEQSNHLHAALIEVQERLLQLSASFESNLLSKPAYSTKEFAERVNREEYTVRNWCREGRVLAEKVGEGPSASQNWKISHAELERYQREGLRRCKAESSLS